MDGIHDLGGRHGFGSDLAQRDELTFHGDWEKRVHALVFLMLGRGCFNLDQFRHAIERLEPSTYLSGGYYGRWLGGIEKLVDEAGRRPTPDQFDRGAGASRDIDAPPRFEPGDAVVTRNLHPPGHTRLPGYARARRGTIALHHGAWVLPDTNAHGQGEHAQHCYAVRFDGEELWGEEAEPGTSVCIDLFERYLEPA